MINRLLFVCIVLSIYACDSNQLSNGPDTYPAIQVAGAMKNVMWKGELGETISMDTIREKKGLYGVGPISYLKGEILINDGITYISKVTSDSSMIVKEVSRVSAPFFVYGNVIEWQPINLPEDIKSIKDLEVFIGEQTKAYKRPFVFKLMGKVDKAKIHVQNLPDGTAVSSPKEAHQGQVKYEIDTREVEIVGFFSTKHQGVFTHHDTFLHMHLITKDKEMMGHLDEVNLGQMRLYLPKK
ncbi:MAG: acetolactate decarboxylase [Bacteroidota bacterium]